MSPAAGDCVALAGRIDIDLRANRWARIPAAGRSTCGMYAEQPRDWSGDGGWRSTRRFYRRLYTDFAAQNPMWNEIPSKTGDLYAWDERSDYIQEPPFFEQFGMQPVRSPDSRCAAAGHLWRLSHDRPHFAGRRDQGQISAGSTFPAAGWAPEEYNSYGSRRGNDRVMTRGTFANVRIKNLMVPGWKGRDQALSVRRAAQHLRRGNAVPAERVPLIILAGQEYGTGSSRIGRPRARGCWGARGGGGEL